jgi:hypothetical protein
MKRRQQRRVSAWSLLCFWAVRELARPPTALTRQLGMSAPGVGFAAQ